MALFADDTIPAFALGVLGGGSTLVTVLVLLFLPNLGGGIARIAASIMMGFEPVEIVVVGFTPILYPTLPQGWLQVVYLAVGAVMAAFGWRLWHVRRMEIEPGSLSRSTH
jgi:hypothetical protein